MKKNQLVVNSAITEAPVATGVGEPCPAGDVDADSLVVGETTKLEPTCKKCNAIQKYNNWIFQHGIFYPREKQK